MWTATTAYVPSPSTALRCAWQQCKHIWVLDVVRLAGYSGCWLSQHGHKTSMNMLRIPDHQSLPHLMIQTLWLMCTGTTEYVPRFQYSAQMCITPMQAQVSMLIKCHQLMMVKFDADRSSPTLLHLTGHTSLVTNVDWKQVHRSVVQNINASTSGWHLLRMVGVDSENLLIKLHQLMIKYVAQPLWLRCTASTACAQSNYNNRMCMPPTQAYLGAWCSWVSCTQAVFIQAAYLDMMYCW